jgi:hypothetical protein
MIKYKRSAQDAVYDVLATLKGGIALTSKEIYNELEPADQGLFVGGVDGVMKSINKLHTRGLVVNGNSEVVNGRMVKTWRLKDEVSTNKLMVISIPEAVESETVEETVEEAEHKSFVDNASYSVESLIKDAQEEALLSIASVFSGLMLDATCSKPSYDANYVNTLINGLLEISDLLSEKIAVKHVIPAVEFLRGLK